MTDINVATVTKRLERLNTAILELEGEDVSKTAPSINWKGNLAKAALPDLDQMLDVLDGMLGRLEAVTHGEGVAQLGAKMKREGDERDPFQVYWEGRQHPRNGHVIESAVPEFDYSKASAQDSARVMTKSGAVNEQNARFWEKHGVRR